MNARRTEALSDSTFAVAMTLLIFDLRVMASTQHTLRYYVWYSAWPHYLGYAVSFLIIGTIWTKRTSHLARPQWSKLEPDSDLRRYRGPSRRLPMRRKEGFADLSCVVRRA